MTTNAGIRTTTRFLPSAAGISVVSYLACVANAFVSYGKARHRSIVSRTKFLLDLAMPAYEVMERRQIGIRAPAETAFTSACLIDIQRSTIIRSLFRARELLWGGETGDVRRPLGLVDQAKAWGWAVLGETPGREIAFGAVTQPWIANPTFRALPADDFLRFAEPNYVKIAWNVAADPIGPDESVVRTETRVLTTDGIARSKFRIYWAFLSPGIILIRLVALGLIKTAAERRTRSFAPRRGRASSHRGDPDLGRASRVGREDRSGRSSLLT
jgi:hypothetical protein